MTESLHIHLGNSPEHLAQILAQELVRTQADDPMAAVHVGVGQRGMERMVQESIAHAHGIAANLCTYFPTNLLYRAAYLLADATDTPFSALQDVTWTPRLLRWAVYAELLAADIEGETRGDVYDPLRHWLKQARGSVHGSSQRAIMSLASQLARVFDAYNLDRPEWHTDWIEEALEKQLQLFHEGGPKVVPNTLAWQPVLWRAVHLRLAGKVPSPVALLYEILHATDEAKARLRRVIPAMHLFGMEYIHRLQRELIQALSHIIPVHLYASSPTTAWWQDVRIVNASSEGVSPLLVRFGEHTRYLHDSLVEMCEHAPRGVTNDDQYIIPQGDHALAHLQRGVITPDAETIAPYSASDDDASIAFHASHGPLRQVEVLHDAILACIERDPSLEASDFVVLCPQLNIYAPLIEAVFHTTEPRLPYRIEDRALSHANPVARALQLLLKIVDDRPNASSLLELLSQNVVQQRFGIDEEEKNRIQQWLHALDVRWGWNIEERSEAGRPGETTSTWESALNRIALGVCMSTDAYGDPAYAGGHVAYADIGTDALRTAGKFTRFVRETFAVIHLLKQTRTVRAWCELFLGEHHAQTTSILARLIHVEGSQSYQLEQVMDRLRELFDHATAAQLLETTLDADAFRTWLAADLEDDTRVSLTGEGAVSFARLSAARFASARVIFLLGMDDGAFPRPAQLPSWDLRQANRKERDHSDRDEDLYALLQAFMLARDHFGIVWQAIDASTGKEQPPALPVLEFQRQIETLIVHGKQFVQDRTVHHRMHPYSIDAFIRSDRPPLAAPFTYQYAWAHAAIRGAKASEINHQEASVPPDYLLPDTAPSTHELSVQTLALHLRNPEKTFLNRASNLWVELPDFRLKHDDASQADALEKFSHYRAIVQLVERSIARTGSFRAAQIDATLLQRFRQDAPVRPGVLGELTLQYQLQGTTHQTLQRLASARRRRPAPIRYTWSTPSAHVHFSDTHLWQRTDGQTLGSDLLYGKPHWDNLLEPWAKLCIQAANTQEDCTRVVVQIHDDSRIFEWSCDPQTAAHWLAYATQLHASLWKETPAWSKVLVRALSSDPQKAKKTIDALSLVEENKDGDSLYRKANNQWVLPEATGGPSSWALKTHGEQHVWRPPWDPLATDKDLEATTLLHTLYAPLIRAYEASVEPTDHATISHGMPHA